jgi:O-antigen ligase
MLRTHSRGPEIYFHPMSEAQGSTLAQQSVVRAFMARLADFLMIATAASLPWSTSVTAILIALWLIFYLPVIDLSALRRTLALPVAYLPVGFAAFALIGMTWGDGSLADRLGSLHVFLRPLLILPLLVQFQNSDRGKFVIGAFFASCTVLLLISWLFHSIERFNLIGRHPGVPVKDYVIQSSEFLICAFGLGHIVLNVWSSKKRWLAVVLGLLMLAFLANITVVGISRSTLVTLAVLIVVFGFQRFGYRGALSLGLVASVFFAVAWVSSPYLRTRVVGVIVEIQDYENKNADTSAGWRLEFWKRSIEVIASAPVAGHGLGSTREQFRRVSSDMEGVWSVPTDNPHQQTFVVAIQLGIIGVALLYALWFAHLRLFSGNSLAAVLGLGIVVQNIVAGFFSSALFEFSLGWLYILGVGVLGGMVLRYGAPQSPTLDRSPELRQRPASDSAAREDPAASATQVTRLAP